MARRTTHPFDSRGQAAVETILLTFVLIMFVSAAFQMHLMNQAIFKSLDAVNRLLFTRAFDRNQCRQHAPQCEYSQDPAAEGLGGTNTEVVWTPQEVPEIVVPILRPFRAGVTPWGNQFEFGTDDGLPLGKMTAAGVLIPKRTRIGAGTYKSPIAGLLLLRRVNWAQWGFQPGHIDILAGSIGGLDFLSPALQ